MNSKRIAVVICIVSIIGICLTFYFTSEDFVPKIDIVAVNDISESLGENWSEITQDSTFPKSELPGLEYGLDYVVLDNDGAVIAATNSGLSEDLNTAVQNQDTIVDIKSNNAIVGKLIIQNTTNESWHRLNEKQLIITISIWIISALSYLTYTFYIDRKIFKPFRHLQGFARQVAEGNLDIPLDMDRSNRFGAFTESFDLMREELAKARENERLADQSKKELVASLSHDIKTPVASIKAVSEIMMIKTDDEYIKHQLEIIDAKADQINSLITNMFNATLEELQELNVTVTEQQSKILVNLIENADYNHKAAVSKIPECLILADPVRLAQVIDNVISNSYKYAGAEINIIAKLEKDYLVVDFWDNGPGVGVDELPRLFNKFYRAKNAEGKSGAGLGLYISKFLMTKMAGDIESIQGNAGFAIRVKLQIV